LEKASDATFLREIIGFAAQRLESSVEECPGFGGEQRRMLPLVALGGAWPGMVTVETIGRIRPAFLVEHKPIRQIVRELRISRQTVLKAIRGSTTEFRYERQVQPQPRLGAFVARLDGMLEANSKRPPRERLTARRLFECCGPRVTKAPTTACSVMSASGGADNRSTARCSSRCGSRRARPTSSIGRMRSWSSAT
jgi:hypothetical protein